VIATLSKIALPTYLAFAYTLSRILLGLLHTLGHGFQDELMRDTGILASTGVYVADVGVVVVISTAKAQGGCVST
jgi:hypothetical protein